MPTCIASPSRPSSDACKVHPPATPPSRAPSLRVWTGSLQASPCLAAGMRREMGVPRVMTATVRVRAYNDTGIQGPRPLSLGPLQPRRQKRPPLAYLAAAAAAIPSDHHSRPTARSRNLPYLCTYLRLLKPTRNDAVVKDRLWLDRLAVRTGQGVRTGVMQSINSWHAVEPPPPPPSSPPFFLMSRRARAAGAFARGRAEYYASAAGWDTIDLAVEAGAVASHRK